MDDSDEFLSRYDLKSENKRRKKLPEIILMNFL